MTSSDLRDRSARPCSPSAQRSASARLLLPDPFGPTTALMPGPNSTLVRSANDLKPWRRRARSRGSPGVGRSAHATPPSGPGSAAARACGPRRRSSAWAAAAVSAARRDGPSPMPSRSPATQTSIRNDFSWSGPLESARSVRRPFAGGPLGELLESALGALERADRCLRGELGGGEADQPRAHGLEAEIEIERAGDGLEGRRQEQRAATAAPLATRPRRASGTRRGRSGRPVGRGRSTTRWRHAGRSSSPRHRRGGGYTAPRRWRC